MQWTIDPGKVETGQAGSPEVCGKAIMDVDAGVVVRTSRRGFRVPSWTDPDTTYPVIITADPNHDTRTVVMQAVCACVATGWCHHGYAAAEQLRRLEFPDYRIVAKHPKPGPARKTKRGRPLTLIPGGKA